MTKFEADAKFNDYISSADEITINKFVFINSQKVKEALNKLKLITLDQDTGKFAGDDMLGNVILVNACYIREEIDNILEELKLLGNKNEKRNRRNKTNF